MRFLKSCLIATTFAVSLHSGLTLAAPTIKIDTSMGIITVELNKDKAPATVANFVTYIESGHFSDTLFHRVIPKFMIQGGGFTTGMKKKPADATVKNEANNGLKNERGTIAMARTMAPHSASAQFFINTKDNSKSLNFASETPRGWGYTVFGSVTEGMDVVDKIEAVKTGRHNNFRDVPVVDVVINSITVLSNSK